MGYNGNNRTGIADRQQGFSKSADKTAERIFYGPKSFRNAIIRGLVGSKPVPKKTSKRSSSSIIKETKTDKYLAKESILKQQLYKCDCGKISWLDSMNLYCPSCGRRLSSDKQISKQEAEQAYNNGCLGLIILPIIILIGICI